MNNLPDSGDKHDEHLEDEADFLDLALGLLSTYSGLRASELLVGSIPEQWPADVPILEGSRIIGSLVRDGSRRENAGDYTDLTLLATTHLSPDDVLDKYDELLLSADWQRYEADEKHGGFSGHSTTWDLEYIKSAYGPRLQVWARKTQRVEGAAGVEKAAGGSPTEVRLYLDKDPNSLWHYRHADEPKVSSAQLMPVLIPPRHSQQWSCAANGSDSNWNSNIGMLTELGSADLMSHYAKQLVRAGWVPAGEGQSGPVMWHTWQVKDERGDRWAGALLILERQTKQLITRRRYYLSVHVYKVM